MIKFAGAAKFYGKNSSRVKALENVDLNIDKGEFVCIMGPSGSGKSTLLNIIGCMDSLTEGRLMIDGNDVSKLTLDQKAHLRNKVLGFVFQSFNLLEDKTVIQNVMLPLKYSDVPKKKRKEKAAEVLKTINIYELKDRLPNQLSGGQQQRVAIARALVNNPEIILADEPTGNLDTATGEEIIKIIKRLNENQKKTIVMVSHDYKIASFADRIIEIVDGRIQNDLSETDSISFSIKNPFQASININ